MEKTVCFLAAVLLSDRDTFFLVAVPSLPGDNL